MQRQHGSRIEKTDPPNNGHWKCPRQQFPCKVLNRVVLNILAAPLEPLDPEHDKVQSYLLEIKFLPVTNHVTVAQVIIECLGDVKIKMNDVIILNMDNASYMKAAYTDVLKTLLPNCTHLTCMAHITNLAGDAFKSPFKMTNKFIKQANAIFWNITARKGRYIRYLKPQVTSSAKLPPNPIATRWNYWFEAVVYHCEHLDHFRTFVSEEVEHCGKAAPDSLLSLQETLTDETERQLLKAEMNFITIDYSKLIIEATKIFQR